MSDDFAVRCLGCGFRWNTPAMAEGLAVLGQCPKCGGTLEFRTDVTPAASAEPDDVPADAAPHLVLGIPRI
jgi:hypothetical protein